MALRDSLCGLYEEVVNIYFGIKTFCLLLCYSIRWLWLLILETKPKWVTTQSTKSIEQKKCCQFHKIWNIIIIELIVSCQFELGSTSWNVITEVHAVFFFFELEIAWWQWIWGSSLSCGLILWYELYKTLIDFWWFSVISIDGTPALHDHVAWEIWQMKF